jgi:MraZ protein
MFRGWSAHTLDDKGRIVIPSRFREIVKAGGGDTVMVTRFDNCLYVYPLNEWVRIEEKFANLSETTDTMRNFRRFFIGGAFDCNCDRLGRVLIPPALREYAELEKEVVLAGALEHFEIWSRDRWHAADSAMEVALKDETVRSAVAKLGL